MELSWVNFYCVNMVVCCVKMSFTYYLGYGFTIFLILLIVFVFYKVVTKGIKQSDSLSEKAKLNGGKTNGKFKR